MLTIQQRSYNQRLLISGNIGIALFASVWGGGDASLFQLYAANILHLAEKEIGFVIGLIALAMSVQFVGIHLVKKWGAKRIAVIGFALLFCLLPVLLAVPAIQKQNAALGFAVFCGVVLLMNGINHATKGVAWQPLIRQSTAPDERGRFFAKMRLSVNGIKLLFFGVLSAVIGTQLSINAYTIIILFFMAYCLFICISTYGITASEGGVVASPARQHFFRDIKEVFSNKSYTTIMIILALCMLSNLPLLVTYLSLGIGLDASYISQLIALVIIGKLVGLPLWGRLIDRIGFKRMLYLILLLLACIWPLWLFVQPQGQFQNWTSTSTIALVCIVFLTSFLQSGLRISLMVGTHHSVTDRTAVTGLTFFNMINSVSGKAIAALIGLYLYHTLSTWNVSLSYFSIDSYQALCLLGAVCCVIAAMLCKYRLRTYK